MPRERIILHCGFGISVILLIIVVASGAEDFIRSYQMQNLRFGEMRTVAAWATAMYCFLNFPVVVISAVLAAVLRRVFDLPVMTAGVLFLPTCVYLSYFWWHWLSRRLTRRV